MFPTQLIEATIVTDSVMAAYYLTALRATPSGGFFFQKIRGAFLFYILKVLDHAHVVKSAIAFVERFKPAAGKFLAFVAEPHQPFPQQFATFFHEGAVLSAWQTTGAVPLAEAFFLQVVLHGQITGAQSTVHPAWSD
jgi:hypothetical protein